MNKEIGKYDWDLSVILGGKTYDELFEEWEKSVMHQAKLKPDFYKTKENLRAWLKAADDTGLLLSRVWNYTFLNLQTNLNGKEENMRVQKMQFKLAEVSTMFSDVMNTIIKNKEQIFSFIDGDEEFEDFRSNLVRVLRFEKHTLSEKEEQLFAKLQPALNGAGDIFNTLTNTEMGFKPALDSEGKEHEVTNTNLPTLTKHKDRELRKNALNSYQSAFWSKKESLGVSLFEAYRKYNTIAKAKNYGSYVDSALFADEIESHKLLEIFYKVVKENAPLVAKYYNLRKEAIKNIYKLDKVEAWDASLPLKEGAADYTPEEGRELVEESLKVLGSEYAEVIRQSFDENWITWMQKKGKKSGAFSTGLTYGIDKKYLFLNWNSKFNDVSTLAHELGHSLHSWFSDKYQSQDSSNYTIFLAEVASTTNEALLFEHMMAKDLDKSEKMQLLDSNISSIMNTIVRQIQFSEFEYTISNKINVGQPVTPDNMIEIYTDLNNKYYDVPKERQESKSYKESMITPMRIPHFYSGVFYVYKYAIGMTGALAIVDGIKKDEKKGVKNLIDFISSGSSKTPMDTLKLAGVDMETEAPLRSAFNILEERVNLFEKTLRELNLIK